MTWRPGVLASWRLRAITATTHITVMMTALPTHQRQMA